MKACQIKFIGIVMIGSFMLFSCSMFEKKLGLEDYIKWYYDADCPMKKTKEIGDYSFISEYRPADFMAISELKKQDGEMIQSTFDSIRPSFEDLHYFVFKIGTNDPANDVLSFKIGTSQEYYGRVQYFAEAAQNDFIVISNNDTFNCVLYHFERTYNTSPYNNIILGFEKNERNSNVPLTLVFNDRILGNGKLLFSYSQNALSNIPVLQL